MEEEILMPLGLKDVSVGEPDGGRIIEGSRLGFRKSFDYHVPVRTASIPAGYFYSNTESIGLWLKAWIENADSDMDEVISNLNENGDYYAGWECFGDDVIGHSGGTPNYSSRIVFSRSKELGVCVLTDLNVAATTDSLCNSLFEELDGGAGSGLVCDVWTVFDIIFTSVSVIGIALLIVTLFMKKKGILIGTGAFLAVLLVLVFVLFPLIFGAGIRDIAFVWAPWSFIAGIVILMADMAGIVIKLVLVKVNRIKDLNISFTGKADGKTFSIDIPDIYYIENVERKIFLYSKKDIYRFDGTMSDIDSAIADTDLVRISRTCFMNVSHLKEIMQMKNSHLEAVLDNEEKLIVSRKYLQDIKKIFRRKLL